jgi:hypothetical protein
VNVNFWTCFSIFFISHEIFSCSKNKSFVLACVFLLLPVSLVRLALKWIILELECGGNWHDKSTRANVMVYIPTKQNLIFFWCFGWIYERAHSPIVGIYMVYASRTTQIAVYQTCMWVNKLSFVLLLSRV